MIKRRAMFVEFKRVEKRSVRIKSQSSFIGRLACKNVRVIKIVC